MNQLLNQYSSYSWNKAAIKQIAESHLSRNQPSEKQEWLILTEQSVFGFIEEYSHVEHSPCFTVKMEITQPQGVYGGFFKIDTIRQQLLMVRDDFIENPFIIVCKISTDQKTIVSQFPISYLIVSFGGMTTNVFRCIPWNTPNPSVLDVFSVRAVQADIDSHIASIDTLYGESNLEYVERAKIVTPLFHELINSVNQISFLPLKELQSN